MKNLLYSNRLKLLLSIVLSTLSLSQLQAQVVYKLSSSKDNIIKIAGKSNVHDWTMRAENPVCEASFGALSAEEGVPRSLTVLNFSVNAKNLKSESESMNNRTYKAIKADSHPQITFKLKEAAITNVQKGKFLINAKGTLTIAGVSKIIELQVKAELRADQSLLCTGEEKIKLTDYGIQPPSFMLGAMKVGNDLDISFSLNLKK